jgi:protoporphyrinogen oxidase
MLDPEQARRRVSAGSLGKMIRKALNSVPGLKKPGGGRFYYPKHGFGSISEAYAAAASNAGAKLKLRTSVHALEVSAGRVEAVHGSGPEGRERFAVRQVLSTIPITQLVRVVQPAAPDEILAAACALKFRAMILIYLVLDTDRFSEFDAHYFPDSGVAITRLSEPRNYSLANSPGHTVLCAELPCSIQDPVWRATDKELAALVTKALDAAEAPLRCAVVDATSRRLAQAYPIYTQDYRQNFDRLDGWLGGIEGLLTFGRQGLFAHDNTHHALAMAYAADRCIDNAGRLDEARWTEYRREFRDHVVED